MSEEDEEEMSLVRFQEPEETRHRQSTSNGRGRHHHGQQSDHHDRKQKKKSHHHHRRSSNSDTHERARRYIYSAISATFFFVLFREIGWIDQLQNALAESTLLQYHASKYNDNLRNQGYNQNINAGSVPSLASATATSMRLGNALDGVGVTTHDSLSSTSTSMNGAGGQMMNAAGQLLGNSEKFLSKKEMMEYVKKVDDTIVPNSRPIMYTFFEWIPPRSRGTSMSDVADKALITEWKAAWKAAGWHPIVLTLDDAKKHVDYSDYAPKLAKIPMLGVSGVGHGGGGTVVYNQLCFYRWLAVAAAGGGFMSDYDVFPISRAPDVRPPPPPPTSTTTEEEEEATESTTLQILPQNGNFTVYCRIQNSRTAGIPCLMSGRAEEWTRMAYALLENGIRNTKPNDNNNNAMESETMWSDMLALIDMRNENMYQVHDAVLEGQKVLLERDWTVADCQITATKEAVHFSHESLKLGYLPPGQTAENRPEIIQRFLTKWQQLCGDQMEKKQMVLGISSNE